MDISDDSAAKALPQTIIEKIIEAHGGAGRWRTITALEAVLSVRGFLFTAKRIPVLNKVRVRASAQEPRFTFFDFPEPGLRGELFGDREVAVADSDGTVIERRLHPRAAFRGLRRNLWWDTLDFLYFGGYATWNYLVTPFLFLRDGFQFEVMEPLPGPSGPLTRLGVTFPEDIPTHCRKQIFYFDERSLLLRLDYTAQVVGKWAHAAHFCDGYREFGGLKVPTRRWVRPLFIGNSPLPLPTLVAIELHDFLSI